MFSKEPIQLTRSVKNKAIGFCLLWLFMTNGFRSLEKDEATCKKTKTMELEEVEALGGCHCRLQLLALT